MNDQTHILSLRRVLTVLVLLALPLSASAQWVKLSQFNGTFFNEVFFASSTLGFITGHSGTVYRTTNGGDSWNTVSLPNAGSSSNRDIAFPTQQTGFISGEDGIWKTTDGGANWSEVTPSGATGLGSSSCWFRNASVGVWAYGSCRDTIVTFWRTTDGGSNWSVSYDTASSDVAVGGITYASGEFKVSGGSGKFWRSTDDGATWSLSNTNSAGWQEDLIENQGVLLIASANGTSCGSTGGGKIMRSTNGGSSWTATSFASVVTWGVSMYSSTNGVAVGDRGAAFLTTDGGATWNAHSCGLDATDRLDDVFMISSTNGFAVGDGVYRYRVDTFATVPDTIDFGDVVVGTKSPYQNAIVRSLGTSGSITLRQIAGTDGASFTSSANLGGTVAVPQCNDAITPVRFEPTRTGTHVGRLNITLGGSAGTLSVVLIGNGVRPRLSVDDVLLFDTIICATEAIDSLEVRNFGSHELIIDSVQIANDLGFFTLLSPALPLTIPPFASNVLRFHARAVGTGTMSARAYIHSSDPDFADSSKIVRLKMVRLPSELDPTPDTIVIPPAPYGETSDSCIQLFNSTEGAISVTGITSLDNVPEITLSFPGDPRLQPGASRELCFQGAALDSIPRYERFSLKSTPCDHSRIIVVCYQARPAGLALPEKISLQGPCGSDLAERMPLTNDGSFPVRIDSITVGSRSLQYTGITVPADINPGESLDLDLVWSGLPRGVRTSWLILHHGETDDTVTVEARWTGPDVRFSGRPEPVEICEGDTAFLPLRLRNHGELAGTATPRLLSGSPGRVSAEALSIGAGDSVETVVSIEALPAGLHEISLIVERGCGLFDTITAEVVLRVSPLSFADNVVDLGIIPPGGSSSFLERVYNRSGEAVDDAMVSLDPTAGILLPDGPGPFVVLDSVAISFEVTAGDEGNHEEIVLLSSAYPCAEDDTLRIIWKVPGREGGIELQEEFGDGLCDSLVTARLTIRAPFDRDATVDSLSSVNGAAATAGSPSTPFSIPRGESIEIEVSLGFNASGEVRDTLRVVLDGVPISAPVHATWSRPESNWISADDGRELDTVVVRQLAGCTPAPLQILIRNDGNRTDSVRVVAFGTVLQVTPLNVDAIPPGGSTAINIIPDLQDNGIADFPVTVESLVCGRTDSFVLRVIRSATPLLDTGQVVLAVRCADSAVVRRLVLPISDGFIDQVSIRDVSLDDPDTWQLLSTWTTPDSIAFEFSLGSDAPEETLLNFTLESPCAISYSIPVRVGLTGCSYSRLRLSMPTLSGAWGDTVLIPVVLDHLGGPAAVNLPVGVDVDSRFLHLLELVSPEEGNWQISEAKVGDQTGRIEWQTSGGVDEQEVPSSSDTIALIRGVILRGPVSHSPLAFDTTRAGERTEISFADGMVALTDFCDSYGRLLEVTGEAGLRSLLPNPTDGRIEVRYFIPALTRHRISIVDIRGTSVLFEDLGEMPPGERIEDLDLTPLSTGRYLLVIEAGRFRLVEEIFRR